MPVSWLYRQSDLAGDRSGGRGGRREALVLPTAVVISITAATLPTQAMGQIADNNAITSAEDAFGTKIGRESLGIYGPGDVRGFSPNRAGNIRIEGMYFDQEGFLTSRVTSYSTIKVGPSSQGYPLPAPTGIVDYTLMEGGDEARLSPFVLVGPFGSYGSQLDAQIPIDKSRLSLAASAAYFRTESVGTIDKSLSAGSVLHFRPTPKMHVMAFYGQSFSLGQTAQPIYIPEGDFLPEHIVRGRYPGPGWTSAPSTSANAGLIAKGQRGSWSFAAAAFRSLYHFSPFVTNLIFIEDENRTQRSVVASPVQRFASVSGEARASRTFAEGPRKHLVLLSVRGRQVSSRYGGDQFVDLGPAELNSVISVPKPDFEYGPTTADAVKQLTLGASYSLDWKDIAAVTLGIQRSNYTKMVASPGAPETARTTRVWLPSISGTAPVTNRLSIYGSYVKGLEEAGNAPGFAANANELLPANLTRQYDAGVVWKIAKGSTLILGYFDIEKPYLALDKNNIYGALGTERHRGLEASLTSTPLKNLSIVAGAVVGRPRVSNPSTAAEVIGPRPVGQSDVKVQLNADYTLPFVKRVSVDGSLTYSSSAAGTVNNAVIVPGQTVLNLGARYHFKLGKAPATLRLEVDNVTNTYSYYILGSGAYVPIDGRGVSLYLAADF